MLFNQQAPSNKLSCYIKEFWQIENDNLPVIIKQEKIIPDGFPELIFHYNDTYRININGLWELQSKYLIAGQLTNHFYLENTGSIGMFGIKLQPNALSKLFSINMESLTDKALPISKELYKIIQPIILKSISKDSFENKVNTIEQWFSNYIANTNIIYQKADVAIDLIRSKNGTISIKEIIDNISISERSLERYFKYRVGVSPKFYCRIIRFAHIFKIVSSTNNWTEVAYETGYYDQSHFIKNFKEFTGEDPSKYGFNKVNMANFFLKKA